MENQVELRQRIEKLIYQLEKEKSDKNSSYTFCHVEKAILLLTAMVNNISNPSAFVDITQDIKTIIYWSADSWTLENPMTKDICETIECYEKLMKNK